ncbi:hypothetical protein DPEC_G00248530 [Dallia pectoralis]|uniref:Uncharacterized protein n=1 Tax=Dallia pectoralis TaxID=75939 RepID=A0ACC2FWU2_DALPE|nr:hypothetical protein DPEC_G00248530 [Dallia pectoralis]
MSIEELTRAVHSINKQKAPGPDWIPGEFYQTFWDLIKNDVAETCSIPEWSINDNLLLVRDVILHSQERGSPLGLLSLDQEKAFDRVSHGFLQRVLKKMNFPQHLINWTNLCYENISSRVLVKTSSQTHSPSDPA